MLEYTGSATLCEEEPSPSTARTAIIARSTGPTVATSSRARPPAGSAPSAAMSWPSGAFSPTGPEATALVRIGSRSRTVAETANDRASRANARV